MSLKSQVNFTVIIFSEHDRKEIILTELWQTI